MRLSTGMNQEANQSAKTTEEQLKHALLNLETDEYEKVRKEIIADIGYDNFRELQNRVFKQIGTIKSEGRAS